MPYLLQPAAIVLCSRRASNPSIASTLAAMCACSCHCRCRPDTLWQFAYSARAGARLRSGGNNALRLWTGDRPKSEREMHLLFPAAPRAGNVYPESTRVVQDFPKRLASFWAKSRTVVSSQIHVIALGSGPRVSWEAYESPMAKGRARMADVFPG